MKSLFALFVLGVILANGASGDDGIDGDRLDCLYNNFEDLLDDYNSWDDLESCVKAIPKSNENLHECVGKIIEYNSDMHQTRDYVHECEFYEKTTEDIRVCRKPLLELWEMGSQRILEFIDELRSEIKLVGNCEQRKCVRKETDIYIKDFTRALNC